MLGWRLAGSTGQIRHVYVKNSINYSKGINIRRVILKTGKKILFGVILFAQIPNFRVILEYHLEHDVAAATMLLLG